MKNILIVCTHLTWDRSKRTDFDFIQPMVGVHIASLIDQKKFNVTLHHELWHGPFDVSKIDFEYNEFHLVFLAGLQKDFDRMRQISYHFRRAGSKVVAGGSVCTMYPGFAQNFFDVVCVGNVDTVSELMRDYEIGRLKDKYDSFGVNNSSFKADNSILKKCKIFSPVHLIEASRGCKYKCGFCTLPAEDSKYNAFDFDSVVASIENSLKHSSGFFHIKRLYPMIWFIDNLFAADPRQIEKLLDYIKNNRKIKGWGALISQNVLADRKLIKKMAESKCTILFSGIESLDINFLEKHKKKQNFINLTSVLDDIDYAQNLGVLINYGWLFDPRISNVNEMKKQVDVLIDSNILTFPSFFSSISPLIGTQTFWGSVKERELLPNLRLRDLDGTTISFNNAKSSLDKQSEFFIDIFVNIGKVISFKRILIKTFKFIFRYRLFHPVMWYIVYRNNFRPFHQADNSINIERNFLGGIDILDPQYYDMPDDISEIDKERYFDPVMVTDQKGDILPWLNNTQSANKMIDETISV
jgi:hypothetical protein